MKSHVIHGNEELNDSHDGPNVAQLALRPTNPEQVRSPAAMSNAGWYASLNPRAAIGTRSYLVTF